MDNKEYIAFGWWNTSLSLPNKQSRASAKQRKFARDVITLLLDSYKIDCLGLGEISSDDIDYFRENLDDHFSILDGTEKAGRTSFDTGVIYNRQKLSVIDKSTHIDNYAGNVLKVANRVSFRTDQEGPRLHILTSHWPSRLWCSEHSAKRNTLGTRLHDIVREIESATEEEPLLVFLGDYNDEPFNQSLESSLHATRDRRLATKSNCHLYNPFWRCIGESELHVPGKKGDTYSGTYYHKSGTETKWRTFDQIMFSSSFLTGKYWQLDEVYTKVLQIPSLAVLLTERNSIFDHFPVMSVIIKMKGEM